MSETGTGTGTETESETGTETDTGTESGTESETVVDAGSPEQTDEEALFSLLGRAHTMEILHEFVMDDRTTLRFGDLQDALDLSPNTLSRRLAELVEMGFLERTQYDEIPPRVEYEPTDRLLALEPMFRELNDWLDEYGAGALCQDDD